MMNHLIYHLISYANLAAHFISAYNQGLTGPEAAWANHKYHGHHTLPPGMALKQKMEHEKKYSGHESILSCFDSVLELFFSPTQHFASLGAYII